MNNKSKFNVLVTGGAGYIGSHIVMDLCEKGYNVIVFDNFRTGNINNVHENAKIIKGDICKKEDLDKVFHERIDIVYHFAALKIPSESMQNPSIYAETNIVGTLNLLNIMALNNTKYIVFSSSCAVYGNAQYLPIDEKHSLKPINYYGYTKLNIEQHLDWYSKLYGIKYSALRYFNAVGYDVSFRIKEKEAFSANLFPIIMKVGCGDLDKMYVYGADYKTDDGSCVRDYIHVSDLSSAHLLAMEYIMDTGNNLITNLATGKGYSVLNAIKKFEEIIKININFDISKRREGDPDIVIAKTNHAKKVLGWSPKFSDIDTIIRSMWNVYKK